MESGVGRGRLVGAPDDRRAAERRRGDRRRRRSTGARSPAQRHRPRRLAGRLRASPRGGRRPDGRVRRSDSGAVVFYRRGAALAIATDPPPAAAVVARRRAGDAVAHVGPVSGRLEADHDGVVHVVVAFGSSPFDALARARATPGPRGRRRGTTRGRCVVLAGAPDGAEPGPALARLVRRSVLVLDQLTDRATGGIVAAPEMDERLTESGGYGFVWPRDLSYVVLGLLAAGRAEPAAAALRWLVRVQAPEGLWLHRHWTTGELAPSWGLHQLDETGIVLFAAEAAWEQLQDESLDDELWPRPGAAPTSSSGSSTQTGLPKASVDVWKQQDGQHAYTAASVAGGLNAAGRAAARHGDDVRARAYRALPPASPRRSTRPSGTPGAGATCVPWPWCAPGAVRPCPDLRSRADPVPEPARRRRRPSRRHARLLAARARLAVPRPRPCLRARPATVDAVAAGLSTSGGGLRRHAGDRYAGGHEWLLATLWLGLARRALGDEDALRRPCRTSSRAGRPSISSPNRSTTRGARRGCSRSAGATRCCCSRRSPSSGSSRLWSRGESRRRSRGMTAAGPHTIERLGPAGVVGGRENRVV